MSIIGWVILGLIAGFIGSIIVDRRGQGFLRDMLLGLIGALVGGFIFNVFGAVGITGFNAWSFLVAIAGAVIVLVVYHALFRRAAY